MKRNNMYKYMFNLFVNIQRTTQRGNNWYSTHGIYS